MQDIIEELQLSLETAREKNMEWFPLLTRDAEALLRILKMYCWGVAKGDTVTISRKNNLEMAMVVREDEIFTSIEASIEGAHFCHPVIVAASVGDMLDDLSAAIVVMLDEMEKVIDE